MGERSFDLSSSLGWEAETNMDTKSLSLSFPWTFLIVVYISIR